MADSCDARPAAEDLLVRWPVGHTSSVNALAVAERRGRMVIISGGYDQTIRFWDLESSEPSRTIEVGAPVNSIKLIAGSNIVAGTNMGLICVRLH